MKRMKKNPVEKVLEWISSAEFVILLIAMSAMDSPDLTVPIVLIFQALAWLVIVGNRLDWGYYEEDGDRGGGVSHEGDLAAPSTGGARRRPR